MASNPEGGTRKLAAIMFTDVRDFSKKMSENEIAAMELLKVHDGLVRDVVLKFGGTIIKSLGDSFMVDFSSAVNAVRCAIEAQEQFWNYNQGKSEFDRIQIRVGIHLGDVITVGNDIYGDGVNIAARIESITEPTRICVSADIYNQVKNKMPIRAFSIGSIELKNIAEPVEVFELLIDSIPEFSEPSETARLVQSRGRAELLSSQEEEEADRVEAAKRKVDEDRQREEAEKQARADARYSKAEEYFRSGDLDKAEEEIKEIFKIVQMHYEAQMLVLQIEEQRARFEEDNRRRRVREEKKRKEDERQQRIQQHIEHAIQYVEYDQYPEALTTLQEVYDIDPNNQQAKELEEQILSAEEARLELMRLEAMAEADRVREELLNQQPDAPGVDGLSDSALEDAYPMTEQPPEPNKTKLYLGIGLGVIVLIGIISIVLLTRSHLKPPSVIAVFPFTTEHADESYVGEALSIMVTGCVARVPDMIAVSPVSSKVLASEGVNPREIAANLGISHVVRGSVSLSGTTVILKAQIVEVTEGKTLWQSTAQADLLDIGRLAAQTNTDMFKAMGMDVPMQSSERVTSNPEAFVAYLRGITSMTCPTLEAVHEGATFFNDALQEDSTLTAAKSALSDALLEQFKLQGEQDKGILSSATSLAVQAVKGNPNNALAHLVLGESYRYGQQFEKAREEINASLAIEPGNSESLRQLALLSLTQGNNDEALEHAAMALKVDPKNYESHVVKGIVHLFKEQYEESEKFFDEASALHAPDSLLTINYKFRAWTGLDQDSKIIQYCQQIMDRADARTKVVLYYWMGRAYQLRGKLESLDPLNQGLQIADRVLSENPRDYPTMAYYALLQARRGKRPELAVRAMQQVFTFDSTSARVHYWKARVHAIQNDRAKALNELAKALGVEYNFPQVLDPDFMSVWRDPDFATILARKPRSSGATR
ncbi:MAG: tetratricopeptide repeat protein [Ignavibacteriales bacterium]|nr:tetratricopeptide repeat protein [Ignavibacteriales bacterium]